MGREDHAVVVGISRYPGFPDLAPLEGPVRDAEEFAGWLLDPAGGDVPKKNLRLLVSRNGGDDKRPTEKEVEEEFEQLEELAVQNGDRAGRRLYFFLAGHGFSPDLDGTALLTANASRSRTGYHVPAREWANWWRAARYFDEVVLFL